MGAHFRSMSQQLDVSALSTGSGDDYGMITTTIAERSSALNSLIDQNHEETGMVLGDLSAPGMICGGVRVDPR